MPTATVYRDGKPIRTTTLTAGQARDFKILADGVRDAQSILRFKPEMDADGRSIKTGTTEAGVPYSERQPDDIYAALPRIAELLGKHPRAVYPHLDENVTGEYLRDPDGTISRGRMLVNKNTPIPEPFHPAAALASQATTLGMLPADGLRFDYAELTDSPPAGSGIPQFRAAVRWRAA